MEGIITFIAVVLLLCVIVWIHWPTKKKPVENPRDNDQALLFWYRLGFKLELDGEVQKTIDTETFNLVLTPLMKRAFYMGCRDAKLGDDNPNLDYQSEKDILKQIRA